MSTKKEGKSLQPDAKTVASKLKRIIRIKRIIILTLKTKFFNLNVFRRYLFGV